jgi:hypothetical protein
MATRRGRPPNGPSHGPMTAAERSRLSRQRRGVQTRPQRTEEERREAKRTQNRIIKRKSREHVLTEVKHKLLMQRLLREVSLSRRRDLFKMAPRRGRPPNDPSHGPMTAAERSRLSRQRRGVQTRPQRTEEERREAKRTQNRIIKRKSREHVLTESERVRQLRRRV